MYLSVDKKLHLAVFFGAQGGSSDNTYGADGGGDPPSGHE